MHLPSAPLLQLYSDVSSEHFYGEIEELHVFTTGVNIQPECKSIHSSKVWISYFSHELNSLHVPLYQAHSLFDVQVSFVFASEHLIDSH